MRKLNRSMAAIAAAAALSVSLAGPAWATNTGTTDGNETQMVGECVVGGVSWKSSAILTEDINKIPENLRTDLAGNPAHFSNAGYITEVTHALNGSPGIFELNHFFNGQRNRDPRTWQQVWRIPTATQHTIENAVVTVTLPDNLPEGAAVVFDGVSTTDRMPAWGGAYAEYTWAETPADAAVDNGDGTWTVNLGTIPAGEARVYQFTIDMSGAADGWTSEVYTASASLTGTYAEDEIAQCEDPRVPIIPVPIPVGVPSSSAPAPRGVEAETGVADNSIAPVLASIAVMTTVAGAGAVALRRRA
ncbi:hypothetical protein [Corynebacterium kozikiae]|uniref:hypothetical protein n=1 Tax=Corynebacterium kozikiae TaxID=2968469 RepID=UPI00211CB6F4|nr:hypothetical protein [Corynebacterium sp. 76QC2CO]MCQ9342976.1 hypothetical protein [Corynebacterium sp. 76QC2CO]